MVAIDREIVRQLGRAIYDADAAGVRSLLKAYPDLATFDLGNGETWLCLAAGQGDLEVARALLEAGVDLNACRQDFGECQLNNAATRGYIDMANWLLDHGANVDGAGQGFCPPIAGASGNGDLDMVRLLIDRGADVNITYGEGKKRNALGQALLYGHEKVVALLRENGAVEPPAVPEKPESTVADEIRDHFATYFGEAKKVSLQEILSADPPISINVVDPTEDRPYRTLFTTGVSDRPMNVPEGGEDYRYAELILLLPDDWPLNMEALSDPAHRWPIDWMRQIAHYPHDNDTWLGGALTVIDNGDPPEPLAEGVPFTSLLLCTEDDEAGSCHCRDERVVRFYYMVPLYREERDLERRQGTEELLKRFVKHGLDRVLDLERPNVAATPRKSR
jgi:hypothetical protein